MLCTDHGVPQGNIEWRLDVLRELCPTQPQAQGEAYISVSDLRSMRKDGIGSDNTKPNFSLWLGFNQALDAAIDYALHYPAHPQATQPQAQKFTENQDSPVGECASLSKSGDMPDCWVVVKDGRIIGTNDEPCQFDGIQGVRYVPAVTTKSNKSV